MFVEILDDYWECQMQTYQKIIKVLYLGLFIIFGFKKESLFDKDSLKTMKVPFHNPYRQARKPRLLPYRKNRNVCEMAHVHEY